jgi:hypothetical protein
MDQRPWAAVRTARYPQVLMLTAPPGRDRVPDSRYAGESVRVLPEPAGGVRVTPGTRQARPRPQGNRLGRAAWFMHTRRQA